MNRHSGYFELPSLRHVLQGIDRHRNPYTHGSTLMLRDRPLEVRWTERAERELGKRETPLTAEMQLYFSCVVKKRVLFHDAPDHPGTPVDTRLQVLFRAVESTACDPVAFANNFPVRREFDSAAATRFHPSRLLIDYQAGSWCGEFHI
jgi:hypothetical protein